MLCFFGVYLMLVQIFGAIFRPGHLASALLQFIPCCFVVASVAYRGRRLARFDRQTLLIASCLASVFVVLAFDVTKNLAWLDAVPLVGRESRVRNDIASLAIMVAVASFPAACYLMMKEMLLTERRLDEQVGKLQEALAHVRRLEGLLPICMDCHKIRTDGHSWQRFERYICEHSDATFSHGLCPECAERWFAALRATPPRDPVPAPPLPN